MRRQNKQKNIEPKSVHEQAEISKNKLASNLRVICKPNINEPDYSISNSKNNNVVDEQEKSKQTESLNLVQSMGCLTCRKRHVKCSRSKPACQQCIKSKYECYWRREGTKFNDYDVILKSVPQTRGVILDPVRDSSQSKREKHILLKDKDVVRSIKEISQMNSAPEVLMIQDAVSVFSERIKDIEPESTVIKLEDDSFSTCRVAQAMQDEHINYPDPGIKKDMLSFDSIGSSCSKAGSRFKRKNRSDHSESLNQSLKQQAGSETSDESDSSADEFSNKPETRMILGKMLADLESQCNSWLSSDTQNDVSSVSHTKLLLELENRLKDLETSMQVSQMITNPLGSQMDWYTNNINLPSQALVRTTMSNEEKLKEDISSALAITNILETKFSDVHANEEDITALSVDSNEKDSDAVEESKASAKNLKKRTIAIKESKSCRKVSKKDPQHLSTLIMPDIREMKMRITRLSDTLSNAHTKTMQEIEQDGRRNRYNKGLKTVDVSKLPLSITKFMRT